MKKNFILSLILLLNFNYFYGQVVETLAEHPKIKDGMYVDAEGNIYTSSGGLQNGAEIGKYDISTKTFNYAFQVGLFGPIDIDERANGDFVVTNFDNNSVSAVNISDGAVSTIAIGLDGPAGIAIDANDNIYISNFGAPSDYTGHQIHKISTSGAVSVLADSPLLFRFQAMVFNGEGELIVSSQNKLLKVDTETGDIDIWVDLNDLGFGHMVYRTLDSCIYATATSQSKIYKIDSEGVATVYAGSFAGYKDGPLATARFSNPLGIGISPNENILYVGDAHRIRRIIMDVSVGTNLVDIADYNIFPNPSATGMFSIENPNGGKVLIEVFDQTGRRVLSKMGNNSLIELDLQYQSSGLYSLKISDDSNVSYQRIISNN